MDAADFLVTGGSTASVIRIARIDDSQSDFIVTIGGGNLDYFQGILGVVLGEDASIFDRVELPLENGTAQQIESYTIDNTPHLLSIRRVGEVLAPAGSSELHFMVLFDRPVLNVDSQDFIASGTTAFVDIAAIDPQGYELTLSGGDLEWITGAVGVFLSEQQDITNLAGTLASNNEPEVNESYEVLPVDFGDAPSIYKTLFADGATYHQIDGNAGLRLGSQVDGESDGQPSGLADGDGADDDGVSFGTLHVGQLGAEITVNVQGGSGRLDAWIDFNGDGSWTDVGEHVLVSSAVTEGEHTFLIDIPSTAVSGTTYARFRLSSSGGLQYYGPSLDGEVEDYALAIEPPAVAGIFGDAESLAIKGAIDQIIPADFDGDGDLDFAAIRTTSGYVSWFENDGRGSFLYHSIDRYADWVIEAIAVDFDLDGDLDIVSRSYSGKYIAWYENSEQSFSRHDIAAPQYPRSLFVADIDQDGDLDYTTNDLNSLYWYENDGSQNFSAHVVTNRYYLGAGQPVDVDLDGDVDLVEYPTSSTVSPFWYENDGKQNFTSWPLSETPREIDLEHTPDFDGDGDEDVLVNGRDTYAYLAWMEEVGDGTQLEHRFFSFDYPTAYVYAAAVGDFDGDGDLDVISSTSENFKLHRNSYVAEIYGAGTSVSEESEPTLTVDFTISTPRRQASVLQFIVSGNAIVGLDYELEGSETFDGRTGTVVIPAGETTATLPFTIYDDSWRELDETMSISLVPANEYIIGDRFSSAVTITSAEVGANFGDAPTSYPTLLDEEGAAHNENGVDPLRLGHTIDLSVDGQHASDASADITDDGVLLSILSVGGANASATILVEGGPGFVDAWIDWDGNGVWDSTEKILNSAAVVVGDNVLAIPVPLDAKSGTTYARFRVSSTGGLGVTGVAADGEVEDYQVEILPPLATTGVFDSEVTLMADLTYTDIAKVMVSIDFDHDGDLDLVASIYNSKLAWYENAGDGTFAIHLIEGFSARSVEVADLDYDGDWDLIVPTTSSTVLWLENDGSQQFTEHLLGSLSGAVSVVATDLNNDSLVDVAAVGSYGDVLGYLNNGAGVFESIVIGDVGGSFNIVPSDMDAGDLDSDGDIDLVVGGNGTFGETIWLANNGDGSYTERNLGSSKANEVEVIDINGDGHLDVVVVWSSSIIVYRGDGAGAFTSQTVDSTSNAESQLLVVDFNGDGYLDIATTYNSTPSVVWYSGSSSGNFMRQEVVTSFGDAVALAAGDIDANGTIDLVVSHNSPYGLSMFTQPLLVNTSLTSPVIQQEGGEAFVFRFSVGAASAEPLQVPFVISGDADLTDYQLSGYESLDGQNGVITIPAGSLSVDLVVTPLIDSQLELAETLFINGAMGIIAGDQQAGDYGDAPSPYPTGPLEQGAAHLATGPTLGAVRSTEGHGVTSDDATSDAGDDGVTFGSVRVGQADAVVYVDVQNATGVVYLDAWIDFNGDGTWANANEQVFTSIELQPGVNTLLFAVPGGATPGETFARFRVSSTGGLAVVGNAADGEVEDYAVVIEPTLARMDAFGAIPLSSSVSVIAAQPIDFDHDGDYDIAALSWYGEIAWLENNGTGQFTQAYTTNPWATSTSLIDFAVDDLDGDGDYDVAIAFPSYSSSRSTVGWLENDGAMAFTFHPIEVSIGKTRSIDMVDIDGDGDRDLVVAGWDSSSTSLYWGAIAWLENTGNQSFEEHVVAENLGQLRNVRVVDMNHDGHLDIVAGLVVSYVEERESRLWLNEGQGVFSMQVIAPTAGYLYETDINGDGLLDLLQSYRNSATPLSWLVNNGDSEFSQAAGQLPGMWTYEAISVDFDGDGDLDAIYQTLDGTVMASNRLVGDYNDDQVVDADDYQLWEATLGNQVSPGTGADGNLNGVIDQADYDVWSEHQGAATTGERVLVLGDTLSKNRHYSMSMVDLDGDGDLDFLGEYDGKVVWHENHLPGDFNRDSVVDSSDYVLWKREFGTRGLTLASDANRDGVVDMADFVVWRNNLGATTLATPATITLPPLPASAEPSSIGSTASEVPAVDNATSPVADDAESTAADTPSSAKVATSTKASSPTVETQAVSSTATTATAVAVAAPAEEAVSADRFNQSNVTASSFAVAQRDSAIALLRRVARPARDEAEYESSVVDQAFAEHDGQASRALMGRGLRTNWRTQLAR